jgi:hypothetical protein
MDEFCAGMLAVAAMFLAIVVGVTAGAINANQHYYATVSKCIESGAMWVPTRSYDGACLPR